MGARFSGTEARITRRIFSTTGRLDPWRRRGEKEDPTTPGRFSFHCMEAGVEADEEVLA